MVSVQIKSRSKSLRSITIEVELDSHVSEIVKKISQESKLAENRIRLTQTTEKSERIPLDTTKTLKENGINDLNALSLASKDLGRQIGWREVFAIEYLGPILIHPIFYHLTAVYGKDFEHSSTQKIAYYFVLFHFTKRLLETIFVHKFSNATMPFFNVFKNSSHYWILSGVNLSYLIYSPQYWKSPILKFIFHVNDNSPLVNYLLFALAIFFELSNLKTHLTLSNLRTGSDTKRYAIPYGYGFDLVACPNYFFESMAWVTYAVIVGNWAAWLFVAVSVTQMWIWAIKKNKRLLKTFGDEYKKLNRKTFIPYVI